MPYLNIDDSMDEHPKIEALSAEAKWMHVSGMLYCARRGTDGLVSLARSRKIGSDALAAELTRVLPTEKHPVWHDLGEGCGTSTCQAGVPGHYVIHDYLQWNHSKAWWERRSEDQAAKGTKAMHRRWHVRRGVFREDCKHCQSDNASHNNGYSASNIKPVTEPESEPEPESISVSHRPALAPLGPAQPQTARETPHNASTRGLG